MKEKLFLEVKTDTDTFRLHGFLPALSEFGHIEPNRDLPRERTIFNAPKRVRSIIRSTDIKFILKWALN